ARAVAQVARGAYRLPVERDDDVALLQSGEIRGAVAAHVVELHAVDVSAGHAHAVVVVEINVEDAAPAGPLPERVHASEGFAAGYRQDCLLRLAVVDVYDFDRLADGR